MTMRETIKEKLQQLAEKSKDFGLRQSDVPPEYQYGDRITQDKRLISLRRLRNRQLDIVERERLEQSINSFERSKASKDFLGSSVLGKKLSVKKKPTYKTKNLGFLGKGRW